MSVLRISRWAPLPVFPLLVILLIQVVVARGAFAAHLELSSQDGVEQGLNDPTPYSPHGGNPATTLGEARRKALEFALSLWAETLESDVVIRVGAKFESLGGGAAEDPYGLGGTANWFRDFAGAPRPHTWYPAALADKLAGEDLEPGALDLELTFNSDVDGPLLLGEHGFDYSLTLDPAAGDVSFVLIALHEIAHGLGMTLSIDPATGAKQQGSDDAYLVYLMREGASPERLTEMTDGARLAALSSGDELQWDGPAVVAAGAALTAGTTTGGRVLMHAPTQFDPRSNGVHFAAAVEPSQVEEAEYVGNELRLELTRALLEDLGWGPPPDCVAGGTP